MEAFSTGMLLASALMQVAPQVGELPQRATAERPLAELFTNDDYPAAALARRVEGTVTFRIHVGADGEMNECTISSSSKDTDLDQATCQIVRARAHFRPARDVSGQAVPDVITARVRWRLNEPLWSVGPSRTVSSVRNAPDGALQCAMRVDGASVEQPLDTDCAVAVASGAVEVLRALGGQSELIQVSSVSPAGTAEPEDDATNYGELLFDTEVRLSVASDGHIANCRSTRQESFGPIFRNWTVPNACVVYAPGSKRVFEPADGATEIRIVRLRYLTYHRGPERD